MAFKYRADHIGRFLRSLELLEARKLALVVETAPRAWPDVWGRTLRPMLA